MADPYEKYIYEIEAPEPPAGLERKVMRRVKGVKRRALLLKTLGFGALLAGSISILVVGYLNLVSSLAQSGFFDMTSLFFSDFSSAMANFQDYFFSIIESFPVFSAAFLVGGLIAVVWSAIHFAEDIAEMRGYRLSG